MSVPRRIRARIVKDTVAASRLRIGDTEIAYRVRPTSGGTDARTILVLHGFTGQGGDWAAVCDQLAGHGHGSICPDHPGHGDSDAPDDPALYTMEALAELHHSLCTHLEGGPVVLLGHSMGAAAAEQFAIRHRDSVEALILVDSVGGSRKEDWARALAGYEKPKLRKMAFEQGMGALYDYQIASGRRLIEHIPEELRADVRAHFTQTSVVGYFHAAAGMRDRIDTLQALAGFDSPALVLAGENEDPTFIAGSRELNACLPNSRFVSIEDAAHNPQFEAPERLADIVLEFLQETGPVERRER
jgi:pimeloyl-ACP methyl ester carboxylesterase